MLLLVFLWGLIQIRPVQQWLVHRVTDKLSKDLHVRVDIQEVDFSLFNKMMLHDVLVRDLRADTLLYSGIVRVNITDWFFLKDRVELKYIGLEDTYVRIARTDSVWNYQFIADYFGGGKSSSSKSTDLLLGKVQFSRLHLLKADGWRGEDMELRMRSFTLDADSMDLGRKKVWLKSMYFAEPKFALRNYNGNRPSVPADTGVIKNDPGRLRWNPGDWDIRCARAVIENGDFRDDKVTEKIISPLFDGYHIHFSAINIDFRNVVFQKDSITAHIDLATNERSGIKVKRLVADMRFHPEAMEFNHLDLQTEKSHLKKYFAMRFKTFDDLADDFNHKVTLDADFENATVDSDDIAYFASGLKDWDKTISITGHITGPVDDFQAKNLRIRAGQQTELYGDIHFTGLPDVNKTLIDFKSNDFRTTYEDMATLIPSIRKLSQPRFDRIRTLHFVGLFRGTVRDFATSGTIETNLGTVLANVVMRLPEKAPAAYSGTLLTNDFHIGQFMNDSSFGRISFRGKVEGTGLERTNINATLDGNVREFGYHGYDYENIFVNGRFSKNRFNGKIISNDSNLRVTLNGLIDVSKANARFDFDAVVDHANLSALHFIKAKDSLNFDGKLRFNFSGNDIDHFLGKARIYDASFYKRGQRLPFDSLTLESIVEDSSKRITVMSNEFEGAIVGDFSIKELPAAFQEFLHRYYPTYIKPNAVKLNAERFSFVITTRRVDQYLDLITPDIKGLNFANVLGRIDSRQNLLTVNANVPEFSYKNISFYKVLLSGTGNLDSLSFSTDVGEVFVSDSLHFPSTHLQLRSFNDLSDIRLTTSANHTLNAADIDAQVQTLSDGVKIRFNPSTFDINGKTWTIDRNGELMFSRNIVGANALRIYSGDQELAVSTRPSEEGNWNDVHADLKKINIGDFTPFFVSDERMEGLLTGSADITDPFNHTHAHFQGTAEQFRFSNDSVGRLELDADYSRQSGLVNAQVHSDNKDYHFDLNALINTADTAAQPINITVPNLVNTKIDLLEKYLGSIFSNITGTATGNLQIVGGKNLNYIGDLALKDASLHVLYTQVTYKIPSAMVHLRADQIDFGTFQVRDTLGHTGEVTRGVLYHNSFRNLRYDFAINTNKLLLLNTKISDNNQFYGNLVGRANVRLTGPQEDLQMYIKGAPTDSSNLYIPTNTGRESADADFVVWKVYGKEMRTTAGAGNIDNFTVNMDVTANNFANIYLIIDPLTNDIIKANGHGNLQIEVGTSTNMNMRGKYEIDRGNYNFSFQSFIRKPFVFMEGADNFIEWTGDPYDANINVQAVYEAENVQFSDLGISAALGSNGEKLKRYHGPVWVVAGLSEKLLHPTIQFQIQLPPNSELRNNAEASLLLSQIESDQNELNKQVAFLIVFNSFGPLASGNGAFTANEAVGGIVVTSISSFISGTLSSKFSNYFQQVFRDKSIRVNFNTSLYNGTPLEQSVDAYKTYDRTNLNLSVIKSFLNERLTFTVGSALDFGLTTQQIQYAAVQFLPNVTAEWKITPNGRVVLSFFYRDSYNYLSVANHTSNSSGTSISYRRDFDRLNEFFQKKKKKPLPQTDSLKSASGPDPLKGVNNSDSLRSDTGKIAP